MIALTFFFALLAISSAAICGAVGDDNITSLFADYEAFVDVRPPSGSYSLSVSADLADGTLVDYLQALRNYFTAPAIPDAVEVEIRANVSARWAIIKADFDAATTAEKVIIRTCVAGKVLALKTARDAAQVVVDTTTLASFNLFKAYALIVDVTLGKWEDAVGSNSVSDIVAAQVTLETLRAAQRAKDFVAYVANLESRVWDRLSLAAEETQNWFERSDDCNKTCSDALEASLEAAVLDVITARVAKRRAEAIKTKLQEDWQALVADIEALEEAIKSETNTVFSKAVERLQAIAAKSEQEWRIRVDAALEGLSCNTAEAQVQVEFPNAQISFSVTGLTCTIDGKTAEESRDILCARIVALLAGSGGTNPEQFECEGTAGSKRSIQQTVTSNIVVTGADEETGSGTGLVATLTLLLVTLFFHFF